MNNGLWTVRLTSDDRVAAAPTGILLGAGAHGPIQLRLLRQSGTRIAAAAGLLAVQVLALRAEAAGMPVEIVTGRAATWQPVLAPAPAVRVRGFAQGDVQPAPGIVIYDHPAESAPTSVSAACPAADVRPWQCRIDVRQEWTDEHARTLAAADLAIVGRVPPHDAVLLASAFDLPGAALDGLPRPAEQTFALLRRRRLDYVIVEPAAAKQRASEAVGAQLTAPRIAP
jgi:hypothetical protein